MRSYTIGFTALLIIICGSAVADPRRFESEQCGVSLSPPAGWTAAVEEPELADNDGVACHIALRPVGWSEQATKSRWGVQDPPLWLTVYTPATSFEAALAFAGFEARENGAFELSGGYGTVAEAEPRSIGTWSGLQAATFYRGFIHDESRLNADESNTFGGEQEHILLKGPGARVVLLECLGGTPDDQVDCDPAIRAVTETLRFVGAQNSQTPPN